MSCTAETPRLQRGGGAALGLGSAGRQLSAVVVLESTETVNGDVGVRVELGRSWAAQSLVCQKFTR